MDKSGRLKILRILNGYTQDGLATLIDVPRSALSIWESGKKYGPAEESVPKLGNALNVTPGYLTFGYPQISNAVWIPQVPGRPHHLKALHTEISSLFPLFLAENNFNAVIPGELGDGGFAFLIGHDSAASEVEHSISSREFVEQRRKELSFSSLLLAGKQLVDSFKSAFKASNARMFGELMLLDSSIDTFDANVLHRMALREIYFTCNVNEICRQLSEIRKRNEIKVVTSHPGLNYIFRAFMEEVKQYKISDKALPEISRFFVAKCDELGYLPESKIDVISLMIDVRKMLESLGCERMGTSELEQKIYEIIHSHNYLSAEGPLLNMTCAELAKKIAAILK